MVSENIVLANKRNKDVRQLQASSLFESTENKTANYLEDEMGD